MVELTKYGTAIPLAKNVVITDDSLTVELNHGRSISVPLGWYPRLAHGTPKERNEWRPVASGEGIHWPQLDEDISIENLLLGKRSGESQESFNRWLKTRKPFPSFVSGSPQD